jgi:hypothetical protein
MTMTQPTAPNRKDDELADFADRLLNQADSGAPLSADAELRGLQETVARLHRTFEGETPDAETLRRMQANLESAVREKTLANRPAWKSQRSRQRMILGFASLAIFAALLFVLPFLPSGAGGVEGSAGLRFSIPAVLAALGLIVLLFVWLNRRN